MSIPAKRRHSPGEEAGREGRHSEEPTPPTSTTATESIATASAMLTPLTMMGTPEMGQDESKSLPPTDEEEQAHSPRVQSWQGWAELENDPTIFSVMLREWGVDGVQVKEVVPLDAIFDSSPTSTYGLIFLSRYTPAEPDAVVQEAPPELWFANQTSSFSCATVALMNIINNRQDIQLGEQIERFRMSTAQLSSKKRGLALDAFDHVRNVHNSFATAIDRMIVDLRLKEDVKAAARKKREEARSSGKGKKRKGRKKKGVAVEDDNESGFHFVAYVPAHGKVWKLDGMERRPQTLGDLDDDSLWLNMVVPDLQMQWEGASQSELEFSLLSLVSSAEDGAEKGKERAEDLEKAIRLREDWGPLIAGLVKLHAERGTLEGNLWG